MQPTLSLACVGAEIFPVSRRKSAFLHKKTPQDEAFFPDSGQTSVEQNPINHIHQNVQPAL